MKPVNSTPMLLGGLLLSTALFAYADPGQTTIATDLKSSPDANASTVSQLPASSARGRARSPRQGHPKQYHRGDRCTRPEPQGFANGTGRPG